MDSYLIIVDKYLPFPSSNGACALKIANVLSKNSKVTVLSIYGEEYFDEQNNIVVVPVGRDGVNIPKKNIAFGYMQDEMVVNNLVKVGTELCKKNKINTIISFYQPIETIVSGKILSEKFKTKFVPCFFDIVDSSVKTSKMKKKIIDYNYERLYKYVLKKNGFLYLKYYKKYFDNHIFSNKNKAFPVGTPVFEEKGSKQLARDDSINLTYCGSFYEDIRNPRKMLDALSIIAGTNIYLHLYSWGCEDVVEEYKSLYEDNLIVHGRVSSKEVGIALSNANILVNLSNISENQVPGKVMEYYSYGKPVLNFKFIENDPGNDDYAKYPLNKDVELYKEINNQEIIDFINNYKNKEIPFNEVALLFKESTPEYCCDIIRKM